MKNYTHIVLNHVLFVHPWREGRPFGNQFSVLLERHQLLEHHFLTKCTVLHTFVRRYRRIKLNTCIDAHLSAVGMFCEVASELVRAELPEAILCQ